MERNRISYLEDLFGLKGKKILLTGGTRGIGRGLVWALARAGAYLVLLCRDPASEEAVSIQNEIKSRFGATCVLYHCDLSNSEEIVGMIPRLILDRHDIDIFIHSGGVQHRAPAATFPDAQWNEIIGVNLTAGFQLARALAAHWLEKPLLGYGVDKTRHYKRRKIVFIASVLTLGGGSTEIPAYAASKGALGQLTKALNNEWMGKGTGINVNSLCPGYILTDLTMAIHDDPEKEEKLLERIPAGRWGQPDDLAGAMISLCAKSGDYIGGTVLVVDGGYLGR